MAENKERILCAAVLYMGKVIAGYRHYNCHNTIQLLAPGSPPPRNEDAGFLTSHNRFVDRKEGYQIAKENGQLLLKPKIDDKDEILISEDLYFDPNDFFGLEDK